VSDAAGPADPVEPIDNPARRRFEVTVDGHLAELTYERRDGRLVLVHTGVPDEIDGRGVASALVRTAIDTAIAEDLTVVPRCPFARRYLETHPDLAARVRIDWPAPR
jgi:predicted GNAT family acetyltransferase